jgi:alpha-tubulin suppressor-like RCC1 family protein
MCAGDNYYGAMGTRAVSPSSSYLTFGIVSIFDSGILQVTVGRHFICGLIYSGIVRCTGYPFNGQLGSGGSGSGAFQAIGIRNIVAVDSGENHTCAMDSSRHVYCWGTNGIGQIGNGGGVGDVLAPARVIGF